MEAWVWLVAGLILLVAELAAPAGFFLFLLGVASMLVGAIVSFGLTTDWRLQFSIFAVLAVVLPYVLAAKLKSAFFGKAFHGSHKSGAEDALGKTVLVNENIKSGEEGAAELWGSVWRVKNVGAVDLTPGSKAVVSNAEGITLHVKGK